MFPSASRYSDFNTAANHNAPPSATLSLSDEEMRTRAPLQRRPSKTRVDADGIHLVVGHSPESPSHNHSMTEAGRRGSLMHEHESEILRAGAEKLGLKHHTHVNFYGETVFDPNKPLSLTGGRKPSHDAGQPPPDGDGLAAIHQNLVQSFDDMYENELKQPQQGDPLWFIPIFLPESPFMKKWDLWLSLLTMYSLLKVPYEMGFDSRTKVWAVVVNTMCDCFFITDIVFHFRTAYRTRFGFETNWKKIRHHYITEWFVLDLLPAFPMDIVTFFLDEDLSFTKAADTAKFLRLPRLFRLLRLFRLFRIYSNQNKDGSNFMSSVTSTHISSVVFCILLMMHWLTCLFFMVSRDDASPNSWVNIMKLRGATYGEQYCFSLYVATSQMFYFGGGWNPQDLDEVWMILGARFMGVGLSAALVGVVSAHCSRSDSEMEYEFQMDQITDYLREYDVPLELRNKVRNYFEHRYSDHKVFDETKVFQYISAPLQTEIKMALYKSVLERTMWIHYCPEGFVVGLVNVFRESFANPGDILFAYGAIAEELYFLDHGVMQLYNKTNELVLELTNGDVFGDECLLNLDQEMISKPYQHYTTTCISCGYADLYYVLADDIQGLLNFFPKVQKLLEHSTYLRLADLHNDEGYRRKGEAIDFSPDEIASMSPKKPVFALDADDTSPKKTSKFRAYSQHGQSPPLSPRQMAMKHFHSPKGRQHRHNNRTQMGKLDSNPVLGAFNPIASSQIQTDSYSMRMQQQQQQQQQVNGDDQTSSGGISNTSQPRVNGPTTSSVVQATPASQLTLPTFVPTPYHPTSAPSPTAQHHSTTMQEPSTAARRPLPIQTANPMEVSWPNAGAPPHQQSAMQYPPQQQPEHLQSYGTQQIVMHPQQQMMMRQQQQQQQYYQHQQQQQPPRNSNTDGYTADW